MKGYRHRHNCSALPGRPEDSAQRNLYLWAAVLTGALFAILIGATPPGADDLLFLLPAKGHEPGPELWSLMAGEFPRIWETQSGRLGNFIAMPFLYLMPKWIFGLLSGALTTLLILLSCRISSARYGSVVCWLLYAALVLAFPWYDYLTLVTYAVNYLWGAAAAAAAIYCFLRMERWKVGDKVAGCLLMFVAGWLHEGFGAPLTAGLTLALFVSLLGNRRIDRIRLWGWGATATGTFMTFLSPMFWQRSDRESNFLLKFTYKELAMQIGPALLFLAVMLLLFLLVAARNPCRKELLLSAPLLICAGAAIGSAAVFLKYYTGPRTGAPVILYSSLACGYMLSSLSKGYRPPRWISWGGGILIGGFCLLHMGFADIQQFDRKKEYEEATRLYEESADGTFYYDLSYPVADLSLFKTSVRQFHEKVPKEFMRIYFKPDFPMVILPTALRGFTPERAEKSTMTPGALLYHGWIILPDTLADIKSERIHVLTEEGRYLPTRYRTDRFAVPGRGEYQLVTPHVKVLDPSLRIKDVSLADSSR